MDEEVEMGVDPMTATVGIARRDEVVSEGAHAARLLARLVTEHVPACLGCLTQGIGDRLAALRLRGGRYEARVIGAGKLCAGAMDGWSGSAMALGTASPAMTGCRMVSLRPQRRDVGWLERP